jgi:anti-sigma factor RsiW
MSVRTCDDLRPLLGGYVLDALEPDEMQAVREHLPHCHGCAAEHASLAGLPALLDLARPLDRPEEPLSPGLEEAVLDRFARDREPARPPGPARRQRRRLPRMAWTRPRVALGSALAAAAVTVAVMLAVGSDPAPPASRSYVVRLSAAAGEPAARARVALYRVRGGTGAHLWVSGLRPGPGRVYEMLCEGNGLSASAGTFRADRAGRADVRLTTAARVGEYDRIRVVYRTNGRRTRDALAGRLF